MLKDLSPFSRLILEIYKLSEVTPASEFQQKSLEKLNEYLPFDSGMWGTGLVQPDGLKIITLHLHNTTTEMIAAYQSVKHEDLAVVELAKHRSKTIGYNALELFKGSDSMTEFINKFQHRNIFISCQNNHDTKFTEWISLYRSKNEQLCTKKEINFFDNIAPHLMQALALNRKLHLESIIEGEINNLWSLGIADQEGFIYHFDDQFKKLLTLEFGVLKNDIIPCEIIKNLTNSLLYRGNKIIIASKFERDLLYVRVRPVQTIDLLTEIELKVATLINAGLTLHEISDNLCRSINTIRTHSKSIYKKLEINKASQLKDHILKVM